MNDDRIRALNDLLLKSFEGFVYYGWALAARGRPCLAAVEYLLRASDPRVTYDTARHDSGGATLNGMTLRWRIVCDGDPSDLATGRILLIDLVHDVKSLEERVAVLDDL